MNKLFLAAILTILSTSTAKADIGWWRQLDCEAEKSYESGLSISRLSAHTGVVSPANKTVSLSVRENKDEIYEEKNATVFAKGNESEESIEKLLADSQSDFNVIMKRIKLVSQSESDVYANAGYGLRSTTTQEEAQITFGSSPRIKKLEKSLGVKLSGKTIKVQLSCKLDDKSA